MIDPKNVPCEECGAQAGQSCQSSKGNDTSPHAARKALASLSEGQFEFGNRLDK
jgi:hypothetical protein